VTQDTRAKYHLLLNEPISGEHAEQLGLVSLAIDETELQQKALSIAARLAEGAPSGDSVDQVRTQQLAARSGTDIRCGTGARDPRLLRTRSRRGTEIVPRAPRTGVSTQSAVLARKGAARLADVPTRSNARSTGVDPLSTRCQSRAKAGL